MRGEANVVRVEEYVPARLTLLHRLRPRIAALQRWLTRRRRPKGADNAHRLRERGESLDSIVFRDAVADVLAVLSEMGRIGLAVIAVAFAAYIALKWWQRHTLIRELRMARIGVDEHTWERVPVDGRGHAHTWVRRKSEIRTTVVEVSRLDRSSGGDPEDGAAELADVVAALQGETSAKTNSNREEQS